MTKVNVDVEELERLLEDAMNDACMARENVQKAISKINSIKQNWITKQQLKAQA